MKYIVEVENIIKAYGNVIAVNDVSLKIKEGEFFSLLGPSGCGKTTILRIIGGFIDQDTGSVKIDGKNMSAIPPNKRNTSMVFQNLALFPHMNVEENIIYGLKKRKIKQSEIKARLDYMLSVVNLKGLQKRSVDQLSGGQKQRVALARSLIIEPKLLLLDEPLASLDKKLRISMRFELKEIQKSTGSTFLYVTHDQSEALTMSDTIAVMHEGKIVQCAGPDDIYNYPVDRFVADFIGAGNFILLKDEIIRENDNLVITARKGGRIILSRQNKNTDRMLNDQFYKYNNYQEFEKSPELNQNSKNNISFFIRPEKIKIISAPIYESISLNPADINIFEAKVTSRIFEGPDIRVTLFSDKIGYVTAEIKNDGNFSDFAENKSAFIYWNINEGALL
ncbi:MAG: ABC transporter ATP-binding protein [Actinobacteria bacterium]|nr:ABC transporter ATP-binding protein [Actinomycetota bacterium]